MTQDSQTIFIIERIQPTWLQTPIQKWLYNIIIGFLSIVSILLILELIFLFILGQSYSIKFGLFLLVIGEIIILGGLTQGDIPRIKPVENLQWSWLNFVTNLKIIGQHFNIESILFSIKTLLSSITIALLSLLPFFMVIINSFSDKTKNIFFNAIGDFILIVFCIGLFFLFLTKPTNTIKIIAIFVLSPMVLFQILPISILFLFIILLSCGLSIPEIKENIVPNQGIWNSIINSTILSIIFALPCGVTISLVFEPYKGFISGLTLGLMVGLYSGRAFFQHLILRIILYFNKLIPWNYARFLNYTTERIFLQKVGGGYIFIHRLLMEHFAQMEREN